MAQVRLDFGSYLAERRYSANLTQRGLADKCGVSPAYIAALERNTSEPPPLRTCKALARALGVNLEEIWQHSFVARLKRWLKREGYSEISESDLLDFAKKIKHRG